MAAAGFSAQRGSRLRRLEATEALTLNMADNVSTRLPLFSLPLTDNPPPQRPRQLSVMCPFGKGACIELRGRDRIGQPGSRRGLTDEYRWIL